MQKNTASPQSSRVQSLSKSVEIEIEDAERFLGEHIKVEDDGAGFVHATIGDVVANKTKCGWTVSYSEWGYIVCVNGTLAHFPTLVQAFVGQQRQVIQLSQKVRL